MSPRDRLAATMSGVRRSRLIAITVPLVSIPVVAVAVDGARHPVGERRGEYRGPMTLVWQEARQQAAELRREFATGDPYDICRQLGIRVSEVRLPEGVSGMIVKDADKDAEVFIEASDSRARRHFTCAHELGHYIERINVAGDYEFSFREVRSHKYDLHEFFADEFAGELLMPAGALRRAEAAGASTTTLAARFGVSPTAIRRRLERLERHPEQR